jgi:metallo-beta-lactamase family protein
LKIKLSFLGAAQNVTGSRFLLVANGYKILVDCGLYQERQFRERNWDHFPLPHSEIDAVLITHAHLDHCGWLPRLVQGGFRGRIYGTSATCAIAKIVLLDSAKLQVEDAEYKRKRHKREGRKGPYPVVPLYGIEDAEATLPLFSPVKYDKTVDIVEGITASFHDAGHILGASMIKVQLTCNGEKRIILFSGDIGRWDKPILRDPTVFDQADYVLIESTYGDRVHDDTASVTDTLAEVVNSTMKAGGNIVVPSFSVERSQELLYYLNELLLEDRIPPLMAFLDSPMAIQVTEVFEKHPELFDEEMTELIRNNKSPFDFPGLNMSRTTNQSKAINNIRGTVMIIAGSGMCTGGRVKHHLVNNISRPESTVLFVGYQAAGTLGRHILNGAEEVRILGQKHQVKARIVRAHGCSGHADRDELFRWLSCLKSPPRKVFVVHGESDAAHKFSDFVTEKTGWDVSVPAYQDEISLD